MLHPNVLTDAVTIRTSLRPGDLGAVVALHGTLYAEEYGFDPTFEAYVVGPLAAFVCRASDRERLWRIGPEVVQLGSVAIGLPIAVRVAIHGGLPNAVSL